MAAESLSPFVFWGQNSQYVFLKVDLKDIADSSIQLDEDQLEFGATGVGSRGRNKYSFSIEFYLPVDDKKSQYKVTDRFVEFQVQKVGIGEVWPRLTVSRDKPAWLKIDFDKFALEDDSEEEKLDPVDMQANEEEMARRIEKEMHLTKHAEEAATTDLKTLWLFVYNIFQWVGFTFIFGTLGFRYMKLGEASKFEAVEAVGSQLMVCQLAAFLEIIHPLLRLVKTDILTTVLQVCGRNFILFLVIFPEHRLHIDPFVWWLFVIWAAIETIRYPYYMMSCIGKETKMITWLRYTMWIPLYPLGFTFEAMVIVKAIHLYGLSGRWSLDLPNFFNMSFPFPIFLMAYLVIFLIGVCFLFKRMYLQRKKKMSSTPKAKKS